MIPSGFSSLWLGLAEHRTNVVPQTKILVGMATLCRHADLMKVELTKDFGMMASSSGYSM